MWSPEQEERASPVGRKSHAAHKSIRMARHALQLRARGHVPKPDRSVPAAAERLLSIPRDGSPFHHVFVSYETADDRSRVGVPEAEHAVRSAKQDVPPVGRKGHRCDLAQRTYQFRVAREHRQSIGLQAADFLAGGHVPEPHRAIALGIPAARHGPLPIGRYGHAAHRGCMSFQQAQGGDLLRPAVIGRGSRFGRIGRRGRRRADDLRGCRGCWRLGRFAGNSCRFCGRACRGNRSGTRIRPTASRLRPARSRAAEAIPTAAAQNRCREDTAEWCPLRPRP